MGGCSGPLSDNDFVSFDIIASLNLGFIGMKDSIWEFEFMVLDSFHILAQLSGKSGALATNDFIAFGHSASTQETIFLIGQSF